MPVGAGRLDRRITLATYTSVRGSDGGVVESWKYLAVVWAKYQPVRGQELLKGGEFTGDSWVKWTIRYRADIGVRDQISHGGIDYDIQDASVTGERNELLELLGKARRVP